MKVRQGGNAELVWLMRLNQASLFELGAALDEFVEAYEASAGRDRANVRLTGFVSVREGSGPCGSASIQAETPAK